MSTWEIAANATGERMHNISRQLLDEIVRVRGRIVYAVLSPRVMGAVLAAFDSRVQRAQEHPWFQRRGDFAWVIGAISQQIFFNAVRLSLAPAGLVLAT